MRRRAALEIDRTGKRGEREASAAAGGIAARPLLILLPSPCLACGVHGTARHARDARLETQEKNMPRMPITLALCTLLSSAPLVTSGVALAEPATTPESSAQAAPPSRSPTDTGSSTTTIHRDLPARGVESITPPTPMPMNLPDEAKTSEVKNEYAIGIAGLVLGGIVLAAIAVAVLFIVSRRSWSTTQ